MSYFVYEIKNKETNKKYFGYTDNLERRWATHKNSANKKVKDCPHLHNAIALYGVDKFAFSLIGEFFSKQDALEEEKRLISIYDTTNPKKGYNISCGGEPGGFVNEEHRKKCVERMRTNNPMKTLRVNRGTFKKGHKPTITEERNQKISESKIGKNNHNFGNIAASTHLNASKHKCIYCGAITNRGNLKRWHNENCKSKNQ
jgi:group I intron endonuclease